MNIKLLTSNNFCIRFMDTHASVSPFSTQGKAFNGAINMLISATVVKT